MEEKKFDVVVVFGETAAKMYWESYNEDEPIEESELEGYGCVVRHSFDTKAERNAYLKGLEDADGWLNYAVAEERFLTK